MFRGRAAAILLCRFLKTARCERKTSETTELLLHCSIGSYCVVENSSYSFFSSDLMFVPHAAHHHTCRKI